MQGQLNENTNECTNSSEYGFLVRIGGVGSQNYQIYHVEMTKREFLVSLLLKVAGINVCSYFDLKQDAGTQGHVPQYVCHCLIGSLKPQTVIIHSRSTHRDD